MFHRLTLLADKIRDPYQPVCPGGATRLDICLLIGVIKSQQTITEVCISFVVSMESDDTCCGLLRAQRLLHALVELIAAVLPANAPCPTVTEVCRVTSGPVAEPIPACVNDCVLFRNAPARHDPSGDRAALADLDACPECFAPRFVKGTKRNRKIFWCEYISMCVVQTGGPSRVHTRGNVHSHIYKIKRS